MTILSTKPTTAWAEVDNNGRLVLPPEVAEQYGLYPGAKVRLDEGHNFVKMHRPVTHLTMQFLSLTRFYQVILTVMNSFNFLSILSRGIFHKDTLH